MSCLLTQPFRGKMTQVCRRMEISYGSSNHVSTNSKHDGFECNETLQKLERL